MRKRLIWFVINPASGDGTAGERIRALVAAGALADVFDATVKMTERPQHAVEIARAAIQAGVDAVVAVGGDGTINEVGRVLVDSPTLLGIVPVGSGNGLAKHLGIPMTLERAVDRLRSMTVQNVDVGFANDHPFFVACGIGFDAHCASVFNGTGHGRGLANYYRVATFEYFFRYRPIECEFERRRGRYFRITFCNVSQIGNNLYMAPSARSDDGLVDCVVVRPYPLLIFRRLLANLLRRKIRETVHTSLHQGPSFTVHLDSNAAFHCDGEVHSLAPGPLYVRVQKGGLRVIT